MSCDLLSVFSSSSALSSFLSAVAASFNVRFASARQLEEIDGLPESAIAYIKIDEQQIRKMNLNKLTLNQLKKHPYLNFYQAKEICDYRRLKGPLHSIEDLKLLKDFPPDEIDRLKPYICF